MMDKEVQRHYTAVGKVAVEWTRFEGNLREMLSMLAGADNEVGECITAQIPDIERMLDALSAMAEIRSPRSSSASSFKDLLAEIRQTSDLSRHVVHDLWTFDPGTTTRWPVEIEHGQRRDPIPMPTVEVESLGSRIEELTNHFLEFRRDFLLSLNLWPGP